MVKTLELEVGGKKWTFETGKVAKQARGACTVTCGGSVVLVTACHTDEPRLGVDFFPLVVEYREKTYAAGKIPGGFFKREGRPYEKETITARAIDRSVRPLFDDYLRHEVQIIATVLSADQTHETDVLALNGASLALALSPVPWHGPVGAVRVGLLNGDFVINPTVPEMEVSRLSLIVVGRHERVIMLAGHAAEVTEDELAGAVEAALPEVNKIAGAIEDFARGTAKLTIPPPVEDEAFVAEARAFLAPEVPGLVAIFNKLDRHYRRLGVLAAAYERFAPDAVADAAKRQQIDKILAILEEEEVRRLAFDEGRRQDGRAFDELRPITAEVSVLPRTHGSALFTRGQTQALVATTLGTVADEQKIEDLLGERTKAFMLHYNFPPYSVGEVKPLRGTDRREIGHGALAESAFLHIIPREDEFPYTIRVVSDILESNGSSSMASVCGASLSLMDAGVPIKKAVAGISIGCFARDDTYLLLTDIQGLEDHYGDMDFKVAGTRDGVTALQVDMKVHGIPVAVVRDALARAREARHRILDVMDGVLAHPRPELSPYAPRILTTYIDIEKIGTVIGPGGKNVRRIIAETGAEIEIEDDGKVTVASPDEAAARRALEMVKALATEPEVGAVFTGKVTRLLRFGAFVEILPGVEGLIHISQLDNKRVERVEDAVKVGDVVTVKVIEIDEMGRVNLSRKACLPGGEGGEERPPARRPPMAGGRGRSRDDRRGGEKGNR